MIRILFLCHGNICRSPMAEFVMKKLVADAGREDIVVESAALCVWQCHLRNVSTVSTLSNHGLQIPNSSHR